MFVLDDLWIGNILPNEKAPISQNYKDTLLRVVEKEDAILEYFPDDTGKNCLKVSKTVNLIWCIGQNCEPLQRAFVSAVKS